MRTAVVTSIAIVASFLLAGEARADDEAPPEKPSSYAWQTLLVDGAALSTMVVGMAKDSRELTNIGLGTYVFGGPLVHVAHERYARAGIDVGLRVGAPIVVGAVGAGAGILLGAAAGGRDETGRLLGMTLLGVVGGVLGVTAGYVTAVAVDAAVLAAPDKAPPPEKTSAKASWAPTLRVDTRGASMGVAGTF